MITFWRCSRSQKDFDLPKIKYRHAVLLYFIHTNTYTVCMHVYRIWNILKSQSKSAVLVFVIGKRHACTSITSLIIFSKRSSSKSFKYFLEGEILEKKLHFKMFFLSISSPLLFLRLWWWVSLPDRKVCPRFWHCGWVMLSIRWKRLSMWCFPKLQTHLYCRV